MKLIDLQKQTATVTSAASITLGAAVGTFRPVSAAVAAGDIAAGATGVSFFVRNPVNGAFESGEYTIGSDGITLTQTKRTGSSNNGAAVAFGGVACEVYSAAPASTMNALLSAVDGTDVSTLTPVGSLIAGDSVILLRSGAVFAAPTSLLGSASPADTTAPTVPTGLATSGVTQTAATLSWSASTDNSGVAPTYEASKDGTSWTAVTGLSYGFAGLNASTLYTLQVRAVDGSANRSAAASIQCTTAAPAADSTAPVMSGSIATSNVTATGLTMTYSAGTDNVAVTGYDVSVDTGTAAWVANGTNLSYNATGLTAGTPYTVRVRAKDAAGNLSNVLTASVTTAAAGTMASTYLLRTDLNSAKFPSAPVAMDPSTPDKSTNTTGVININIRSAANAVPTDASIKFVWGKFGNPCPVAFTDGSVPINATGNTQTHGNTVVGPNRLGGWSDSSSQYYGTYNPVSNLYIWGTPGDYILWIIYSDGSSKAVDNNTGTPLKWTLT